MFVSSHKSALWFIMPLNVSMGFPIWAHFVVFQLSNGFVTFYIKFDLSIDWDVCFCVRVGIVFVRHAFPLLANAYNIAAFKTLFYTFDVHFDTVQCIVYTRYVEM